MGFKDRIAIATKTEQQRKIGMIPKWGGLPVPLKAGQTCPGQCLPQARRLHAQRANFKAVKILKVPRREQGCSRRFGDQQLENLSRRGLVGSRQVGRASSFSSSDDVTTERGRLFPNAPRSFQSLPEREQGCAPFLQLLSRYLEAGNISVLSVTQAVCALRRVKRCPSTLGVRLVSATYRYGLISVENTTIDVQTDWQEMGR